MKIIILLTSLLLAIGCASPESGTVTSPDNKADSSKAGKADSGKDSRADSSKDGDAKWGYSGNEGPEKWGELSSKYRACSEGKNQSPINVSGSIDAELKPLKISYEVSESEITNNGHTIQVNYKAGSKISVDEQEFELKQYHFHTSSENTIDGKSFPMEVHLVHADKDGNLAVIGVMFEAGKENEFLAKIWNEMPKKAGEKSELPSKPAVETLLPSNREYYLFNGSLTTPPCSEGVKWVVLKEAVTASNDQIKKLSDILGHSNNRPVQPVNARSILH